MARALDAGVSRYWHGGHRNPDLVAQAIASLARHGLQWALMAGRPCEKRGWLQDTATSPPNSVANEKSGRADRHYTDISRDGY
ncbi:MAG: hypothetical protein H6664_10465 [Ardenticatenaceae bacterium]|nr:hypothetical protein [Ardenticatenaceae bacterium]